MNHEQYQWYKEHGICTHCRHEKAEPGKTLCLACMMDNRQYKSKKDMDKQNAKSMSQYYSRKSSGLCVVCGKRPQEHGLKCKKCAAKIKMRSDRRRQDILRSERPDYGKCYICGKPVMAGKKVCPECYATRIKSISKIMCLPISDAWRKESDLRWEKRQRYMLNTSENVTKGGQIDG